MPLIIKPISFACRAERLAWAASCPNRQVIRPTSSSQSVAPHADAGEEVALGIPGKISWCDILNTPFVNMAGRYVPSFN